MAKFYTPIIAVFLLLFAYNISNAQNPLVFIDNERVFRSECKAFTLEDFEDTIGDPNDVIICPGPINSLTTDNCYIAGALEPGFTMSSTGGGSDEVVVITPPRAGVTNVGAGSNNSGDNTILTFDPPVKGVGMTLINLTSSGEFLDVDVFGPGGVLIGSNTFSLLFSDGAKFLGVTTIDSISRIELNSDDEVSELLYDLSFGQCSTSVPTLSEWSLIVMAGMLGIVGFMVMRRREITA
jgi:hypothetical protein